MTPDALKRFDSSSYAEDVDFCSNQKIDWDRLTDKTLVISGATGMIGTFLIDVLMRKNRDGLNCKVTALGRSKEKAQKRLPYFDDPFFSFNEINLCSQHLLLDNSPDFLIHLASTTHPRAYSTDPVGTIESNVMGLTNLMHAFLDRKGAREAPRLLLASSVEIYGQNRGDVENFDESYCGYIDCNTLRAGYPEAKRLSEALCQAYANQYGLDVIISRLPRTYGPTMLWSDTKALSQFIKRGVAGESIVLKSNGMQHYSFLHVVDTVSALLWCLLEGEAGGAYNAADSKSDITLRELASTIASAMNVDIVFQAPEQTEQAGYSVATKATMNAQKLRSLGWRAKYDLDKGILSTLDVLKGMST